MAAAGSSQANPLTDKVITFGQNCNYYWKSLAHMPSEWLLEKQTLAEVVRAHSQVPGSWGSEPQTASLSWLEGAEGGEGWTAEKSGKQDGTPGRGKEKEQAPNLRIDPCPTPGQRPLSMCREGLGAWGRGQAGTREKLVPSRYWCAERNLGRLMLFEGKAFPE